MNLDLLQWKVESDSEFDNELDSEADSEPNEVNNLLIMTPSYELYSE
jgi:hypothetical protein